jgi:hypothetical protein
MRPHGPAKHAHSDAPQRQSWGRLEGHGMAYRAARGGAGVTRAARSAGGAMVERSSRQAARPVPSVSVPCSRMSSCSHRYACATLPRLKSVAGRRSESRHTSARAVACSLSRCPSLWDRAGLHAGEYFRTKGLFGVATPRRAPATGCEKRRWRLREKGSCPKGVLVRGGDCPGVDAEGR